MGKFFGFNENYEGLQDNEAWLRVYDKGKNLMPIKNNKIQRKYNNMFKKKTKVIRGGISKSVRTDCLVPEDIILIEKGDFVPVDGIVLEANNLYLENDIGFSSANIEVGKQYYDKDKPVYQGMKVKSGKGLIQAQKTGTETLLGEQVKEIDLFNKKESSTSKKFFLFSSLLTVILLLGAIGIQLFNSGDFGTALKYVVVMLVATFPISFLITVAIRVFMQLDIFNKIGITLKNKKYLFDFGKLDIICIDKKFLIQDFKKYIQDIFDAGIRIAVISDTNLEDTLKSANEAGIDTKNAAYFSGYELDKMEKEEYVKALCEGVLFYNVSHKQKSKIIKTFEEVKINVLCVGDGIEDLASIWEAYIGISSNNTKRSIDRGLADLLILGNNFTSIYRLIKSRIEFRKIIISTFKFDIAFQIPLMFLTLFAITNNMNIFNFIFQLLAVVVIIMPLLLMLSVKEYNEEKIFVPYENELKIKSVAKMVGFGLSMLIILTVIYIGLNVLIKNDVVNVSIIAVLLSVFYWICIRLNQKVVKKNTKIEEQTII